MNGLITIRGIKKMYDNVNAMLNFDTNGGRGVESGSRRIRRVADLGGYVWPGGMESLLASNLLSFISIFSVWSCWHGLIQFILYLDVQNSK